MAPFFLLFYIYIIYVQISLFTKWLHKGSLHIYNKKLAMVCFVMKISVLHVM